MEVSSLPVLTVSLPSGLNPKTDVTHTLSDMHTHNIASQIPNLDSWTAEKVHENLGEPEKNRISRCDNEPLSPLVGSRSVEVSRNPTMMKIGQVIMEE